MNAMKADRRNLKSIDLNIWVLSSSIEPVVLSITWPIE